MVLKIVLGLIGLSLVVVIHEAGHFIAAKLCGIHVEAFSIGWGKIIYARKWKETEFRVSLFPLGGYCKMQGEQALIQAWENHSREVECEEGDMYAASFWKRIIVSLSGPLVNLIFASLIFFVIGMFGYNISYYPSRIVLASDYTDRTDYPANFSGLQTGDSITAVNGRDIERFDQLQQEIALHPEEVLKLRVQRDGKSISLNLTPELNLQSGSGYVGIYPWIEPIVRDFTESSFFNDKEIEKGDRISKINGIPIDHAVQLSSLLEKVVLQSLSVVRNGSSHEISFKEEQIVSDPGIQYDFLQTRTPQWDILYAIKEGYRESSRILLSSLKGLSLLFKGIDLQSAVSGPLRISYITGDLAFSGFSNGIAEGLVTFFRFIALINIALFVMNLLPIPVLDGGQILLFLVEGILRRKPNPQIIYKYQLLGTIIVFGLIIFATMNDILFFSRN